MIRPEFIKRGKEYSVGSLDLKDCPSNPIDLFRVWLDEALNKSKLEAAMVLSTVGENNRPSSRVVLLKEVDDKGLRFYTSYSSRKGIELAGNPYAAINFYWPELERQVRFEGSVEVLSEEESAKYFDSRPVDSRINAIISPQSQTIPDRDFLINESEKLRAKLAAGSSDLSKPATWGGYLFKPHQIEFWQGKPGRLNDRIIYYLENEDWKKNLLAP